MSEAFQHLREIICERLLVPESDIKPETVLGKDVACDSLDYTTLILEVENQFDITFTPEEVKSVGEVVGKLSELIESKL